MGAAPRLPKMPGSRTSQNYPLGGIKTGPAWRAMWKALGDADGPIALRDLERIGARAGACADTTMRVMLDRFRVAGILRADKEWRGTPSRRQLFYWRADEAGKGSKEIMTPGELVGWCNDRSGIARLQGIEL